MAIVKQHDKRIGVTYAYESARYWDSEKKQSRSRRRLVGIVDPVTGEITPTTKEETQLNQCCRYFLAHREQDILWRDIPF